VRVLKLKPIVDKINDIIDSEYISIIAYIIKMIMLLLVFNHVIACAWFSIADFQEKQGQDTWVTVHGFAGEAWSYQYATAFHWSITQFTPASMDVQPQNMLERSFTVFVVVVALVVFSYLVGSITGALTLIRNMHEEKYKQFWNVRRYLLQNSVPMMLSVRIKKYLEHAWQQQRVRVSATSVKIFSLLSEQLHDELTCAIFAPHICVHSLLKFLCTEADVTMQRLARKAITEKLYAKNDTIFFRGEVATHMYFPTTGDMSYVRKHAHCGERRYSIIRGRDWLCEPVLWLVRWLHLGMLVAASECNAILIDADEFSLVMRKSNVIVFRRVCAYARSFVEWMETAEEETQLELGMVGTTEIGMFERASSSLGTRVKSTTGALTRRMKRAA